MSNRSLLVRRCTIIISLVHFLIFVSLWLPVQFPIHNPGEPLCIGWQEFFPCNPLPSDIQNVYLPHIMDYIMTALIALVVLILPPLAARAILLPRWRIIGLPVLWISLPVMLGACLLFMIIATPAFGARLAASPAVWFPPLGFAISFIASLILALHTPSIRANEQTSVPSSQPIDLESAQYERTERIAPGFELSGPDNRNRVVQGEQTREPMQPYESKLPVRDTLQFLQFLFVSIALLSHLAIALSLFFTYSDTYNPYGSATSPDDTTTFTTGWQVFDNLFLSGELTVVAILLLAALILPAPIYLAYLLPFWRKRDLANTWRFFSLSTNKALTIMGLSLSGGYLLLSLIFRGGDLDDPVSTTHIAAAVPVAAFFVSLLCSTVLINYDSRQHAGETLHF